MDDLIIRKAQDTDRKAISLLIAKAFAPDFALLSLREEAVADLLEEGLSLKRFFVAEQEGNIIGTAACTDSRGRALILDRQMCKRHFGSIRAFFTASILEKEFSSSLPYAPTTGFLEFVCVAESWRGKGVGSALLGFILGQLCNYEDYMLGVADDNPEAIRCYQALGFQEICRVPVHRSRRKEYHAQIYMGHRKN